MPNDGYYYCLNCHSEITHDYNEHCCFCGSAAVAVSGDYSPEEAETAFDLLNKQQQGIVIVPPCKVGDTVYAVKGCFYLPHVYFIKPSELIKAEVIAIKETKNRKILLLKPLIEDCFYTRQSNKWFPFSAYGKTVFLTREEAEQALKERLNNG